MISMSPSSSIWLGQYCCNSATSSSLTRERGKATLVYSSVSAMRPTRSWVLTRRYLLLISSRLVSFCGG